VAEKTPGTPSTLEWAAPSPPGTRQLFVTEPVVYASRTSTACGQSPTTTRRSSGGGLTSSETVIPYMVKHAPGDGDPNGSSDLALPRQRGMLFGALFSSYVLIRTGMPHWPPEGGLSRESPQRAAGHAPIPRC